ncbi:1-phosphofructokinase [uncultured Marinococcus sp.]|uniref:1-phosphofructokinase n=1 Tax=uncultured Marinococcus sp. TaxID=487012 RepID=UPI002602482A|nr:1-phosphofructokinase [uncultured Marinococcus sp.]
MICTVTLNPAIDYVIELEEFIPGSIHRSKNDLKYPGGKGINVSRVLQRLGQQSTALGFVGGFTGRYIEESLDNENIQTDFVQVEEDTRINVKIRGGQESEINGASPGVSREDVEALYQKLDVLTQEDELILAGSVPSSLSHSIYLDMMERVKNKGVRVYLDTSGEALGEALKGRPYFVKPNHLELAELYEVEVNSVEDAAVYGRKLLEDFDIEHVVISMAGEGAVYINKSQTLHASVPKQKAVNSVGAGDSLVAGFAAGITERLAPDQVLNKAVASGSATAFSETFCTKEEVEELSQKITIRSLESEETNQA